MMTQLLRRSRQEQGFTLIELLVVILIIGILAAIAIPIFMNQRKAASDASMKSDLRNAAMEYLSWKHRKGHSIEDVNDLFGGIYINHRDGSYVGGNASDRPDLRLSEGTRMEFVVVSDAYASANDAAWVVPHGEDEFCINVRRNGSNYDYPGNNARLYDKLLYYDARLGGIKTMDEMAAARKAGQDISCYRYADIWMDLTGY